MEKTSKPLRILVIVNLPWDSRLGATRVWMELADQWRAVGHEVEKFSLSDAFRDARAARVKFALRQILFPYRAAAFVKQNAARFDVIDALVGTLPFSKQKLGFCGLLVARSVGLYRLYGRFEQSIARRWPQHPKGKLIGRMLYGFTNRRLFQASDRAVLHADLINVPNEEEAKCVREGFGSDRRVIVQPYGLTDARRDALQRAAAAPESRLAQQRVCFIGMWGARKGAYDWPRIIGRIRRDVPKVQFRFLGTMLGAEAIRADLGVAASDDIEFISDYQPDDLPNLLADCTVGAFPSYVEGFGLAVIEQLAAGVPPVAYDTAGPHDILHCTVPELLVPNGDPEALGSAVSQLLRAPLDVYRELSQRCVATAQEFSWNTIARDALAVYRGAIKGSARPIVFVQPFSLRSAGGGARILRSLLEQAPIPWRSVCSSPDDCPLWRNEVHLRSRPSWGRIEHSRFAGLPHRSAALFANRFRRRLRDWCIEARAGAIHAVPHSGLDFAEAQTVARELSLPFFLSLHDDLAYTTTGAIPAEKREAAMRRAWNEASARFVISDSLGAEYSRRYGTQPYHLVTDGLTELHPPQNCAEANLLRIYFMGLFHMPYERNLRALLDALVLVRAAQPTLSISVTMRCEHVRPQVIEGAIPVTVLPFADQAQVQRDLENADLLYMPLPFGEDHENFARYSLSTKMVTYVGSGVPLLYHGPSSSAAFELLQKHDAAVLMPTLAAEEIARVIAGLDHESRQTIARNALDLARSHFMLSDQTERFWGTINAVLAAV
ncbi:MAG: glycosyltransferase [Verrucomicrobiota bacterium]|nr:glycosyltransferase [Verrucomicrobiota bacterium]